MSFNERFGILLQAQYDAKRSGRIRNFHQQAKFSQPFACIEDVDYAADRKLDAGLIGELASCFCPINRYQSKSVPTISCVVFSTLHTGCLQ